MINRAPNSHPRTRPSASSARPLPPSRVVKVRTTSTTVHSRCMGTVRLKRSATFAAKPARSWRAGLVDLRPVGWSTSFRRMPLPVASNSTSERSLTIPSANNSSRGVVVTTASVKQPAACAASRPFGASSTDEAASWIDAQSACRLQKRLGMWLAMDDVIGGHQHRWRLQMRRGDSRSGQRHRA